jgi:hypothetical protein
MERDRESGKRSFTLPSPHHSLHSAPFLLAAVPRVSLEEGAGGPIDILEALEAAEEATFAARRELERTPLSLGSAPAPMPRAEGMRELSACARRVAAAPMLRAVGAVADVAVDVLVQASKMEELRQLHQYLYFCTSKASSKLST